MQEIILFEKVRNGAYVYMKSDLSSCRRYLISRPPSLWDANLVTQRADVERERVWILYIHMPRIEVFRLTNFLRQSIILFL